MNMIELMGPGRNGHMWLGDLGTDAADRELGEEEVVVVEDEVSEVLVEEKGMELKVEFFDGVTGEGGEYGGGGEEEVAVVEGERGCRGRVGVGVM
ncbi:hypothetical protein LIER_25233 [Lithospermum erythrorhizon]|uniref:Uncharacterized protein n=1 Tax=Lithospermum erythrorhizon TaxID=34254 RepID=A0AAV3R7Q0_LITER